MTNLTKIALGNWTKQSVVLGGTGNITLGAVLQYPTVIETVGVNKSFHYVFRAANNTPIEVGVGTLLDAVTLRRDRVYGRMIEGVYTSGDALTPVDIPEGAFIFTAPTAEMLYDLMREQPEIDYGDVSGTETVSAYPHSIRAHLTADTTLTIDTDTLPPAGVHHELMIKLTSDEVFIGGQTRGHVVTIAGTDVVLHGSATPAVRTLGATETHIRLVNIGGTDAYEMYVLNKLTNVDYGNVSGIVQVSFQHECILANLTADTTLNVITASIPNDDRHHEVIIKLTSDNDPAVTTPFNMGHTVILSGTTFTIDGVANFPPLQLNGDGKETVLRLTNIGDGTNYRVENISKHHTIQNLGVVSGNVTLDIRHPWNIAQMTGSDATVTINAISPDVPVLEPAHFTIVNNGSVTKTVIFNTAILSIAGSLLNQVTLPIGNKVDIDIRRNPLNGAVSYEANVGEVNYNQTASGLATTWNPSDYSGTPPLALSNSNRLIEMTTSVNAIRSARAFGPKNSGMHYFVLRCETGMNDLSATRNVMAYGVATLASALTSMVGATSNSGSFYFNFGGNASAPKCATYSQGTPTTRAFSRPAQDNLYGCLVNIDTGKGWFTLGNALIAGANTDPENDINPHFTFTPNATLYPMISFLESGGNAGSYLLLEETQTLFIDLLFPSWAGKNWTA